MASTPKTNVVREAEYIIASLRSKQSGPVGTLAHHNRIAWRQANRMAVPRVFCVECDKEVMRPVPHPGKPDLRVCLKCEGVILARRAADTFGVAVRAEIAKPKREEAAAAREMMREQEARMKAERDAARAAAKAEAEKVLAEKIAKSDEWRGSCRRK